MSMQNAESYPPKEAPLCPQGSNLVVAQIFKHLTTAQSNAHTHQDSESFLSTFSMLPDTGDTAASKSANIPAHTELTL